MLVGASVALAGGLVSPAHAQDAPDLISPRFQADPTRNYLVTSAAEINDDFAWNVGVLGSWGLRPLRLVNADGDATSSVIEHHLVGNLMASVAFSQRVQVSLDVPMVLYQEPGDSALAQDVSSFALGDVRAATTVTLWTSRDAFSRSGVAFGLVADVLLPSGASDAFAGEGLRVEVME